MTSGTARREHSSHRQFFPLILTNDRTFPAGHPTRTVAHPGDPGHSSGDEAPAIMWRLDLPAPPLPAIAVRCAQHLIERLKPEGATWATHPNRERLSG